MESKKRQKQNSRKATTKIKPAQRREICRNLSEKSVKRIPALPASILSDSGQKTASKRAKNNINYENLTTAIRCYFEVEKRYNPKDYILTRLYMNQIIKIRGFYEDYSKRAGMYIFENYMQGGRNSRAETAKKTGISVRDCNYIINDFTNLFANDILTDLQAGKLTIKDYFRNKTKTQKLREANKYLTAHGMKPLPLRKKSDKEKVRDFKKYLNELKNEKNLNNGND